MTNLSPEQQKYFAWLLTCKKSGDDNMRLAGVLSEAKVDLNPHQVEKTFFSNRGETDYFVDGVTVLDKDFANVSKRFAGSDCGRVIDTVYVVIDKNELKKHINN